MLDYIDVPWNTDKKSSCKPTVLLGYALLNAYTSLISPRLMDLGQTKGTVWKAQSPWPCIQGCYKQEHLSGLSRSLDIFIDVKDGLCYKLFAYREL